MDLWGHKKVDGIQAVDAEKWHLFCNQVVK
jgi:hypothetical protein